jgi:undecaprenyl-diphosphatase
VNEYLLSLLLGIIEGITEFLPVSSTAHLRIAEKVLQHHVAGGFDMSSGYWKMYTVVIQLGAVLCLPVYFRKRIAKFISTFPRGENGDRTVLTHPLTLVMIAFVVTAIPAFLLAKVIGDNLDNFKIIGGALVIGGAVMWAVDWVFGKANSERSPGNLNASPHPNPPPEYQGRESEAGSHAGVLSSTPEQSDSATSDSPASTTVLEYETPPETGKTVRMEQTTLLQAIWIGAVQILSAVFPGTSRSMATIAAGQVAGMTRATALEFSFFLSMPTMFAATLFALKKAILPGHNAPADPFSPGHMSAHQWIVLAIGFIVSFLVAWGVVAWFMNWVRRRGFAPFAIWRIVLGIVVLVLASRGLAA